MFFFISVINIFVWFTAFGKLFVVCYVDPREPIGGAPTLSISKLIGHVQNAKLLLRRKVNCSFVIDP